MATDKFCCRQVFIAGGSYFCHNYVKPNRVHEENGHRTQEKPAMVARGRLSRDTAAYLLVELEPYAETDVTE